MDRNVRRVIAEESFEYGNHRIDVQIKIRYTNQYNGQRDILNQIEGYHYYRFVRVSAQPLDDGKGFPEVSHQSSVALDDDDGGELASGPSVLDRFLGTSGDWEREPGHPGIPEHVEYTVGVVLDELDELYEYTTRDVDLEVDVAMDRVEAETSWTDVDDRDELVREIGEEMDIEEPTVDG